MDWTAAALPRLRRLPIGDAGLGAPPAATHPFGAHRVRLSPNFVGLG
ncbi:MAG: hypothetical protein WBM64_00440 [Woeseiaceae bacterium]